MTNHEVQNKNEMLRGGNWIQRDQWEYTRERPGSDRMISGALVPGSLSWSLARLRRDGTDETEGSS
jgi:hypothetical protein